MLSTQLADEAAKHSAWRLYEQTCVAVMSKITEINAKDATHHRDVAAAHLNAPGIAQWFMVCILCAVMSGAQADADHVTHDRLMQGATQTSAHSHRQQCTASGMANTPS